MTSKPVLPQIVLLRQHRLLEANQLLFVNCKAVWQPFRGVNEMVDKINIFTQNADFIGIFT